jgi:L-lysine 2,3-aminomutase
MNNNWQHNARNTLKGADSCNAFFQSKQFQDQGFPIKIPLEFANLIDKDNPDDPLLKQVVSNYIKCSSFTHVEISKVSIFVSLVIITQKKQFA